MRQAERVLDLITASSSLQDYDMYMSKIMRVEDYQLWSGDGAAKCGTKFCVEGSMASCAVHKMTCNQISSASIAVTGDS